MIEIYIHIFCISVHGNSCCVYGDHTYAAGTHTGTDAGSDLLIDQCTTLEKATQTHEEVPEVSKV